MIRNHGWLKVNWKKLYDKQNFDKATGKTVKKERKEKGNNKQQTWGKIEGMPIKPRQFYRKRKRIVILVKPYHDTEKGEHRNQFA